MKIDSFKDLKALIKLCRTMGVDNIEVDGIKLNLGQEPVQYTRKQVQKDTYNTTDGTQDVPDSVDMPDELTDEQKLFWSANIEGEQ